MPARRVAASAASQFCQRLRRGRRRVTMSLASIGSYQAGTSVPRSTQLSTRASAGKDHLGQQAGAGLEVLGGVFGVEAHLNRRALCDCGAIEASGGSSPAASRTIHPTRSTPVTCSVTPCSTCRRVLTSRK